MIATRRYSGYVSNTISNSRRIKMKKMLLAFIAFLSFSLSADVYKRQVSRRAVMEVSAGADREALMGTLAVVSYTHLAR